jgi:hypothetical protein
VYVSLEDELIAMVGRDVYDLLTAYMRAKTAAGRRQVSLLAHPTVRARPKNPGAGGSPV